MDQPAIDAINDKEVGFFERGHHQVFLAHYPTYMNGQFCRFIYVEVNSLQLAGHSGHKFWVTPTGGQDGQESVQRMGCSKPTRSNPKSSLRPVGWVQRDNLERIRQICGTVPPTDYGCCHQWTNAAIEALREAAVLLPLRESDNGAIFHGPSANTNVTF
ncbi:hypothetical protein C8A01DRAFT_37040 [Parachaetomium inaequale]|uniref:Uncharacterized protein n=1 Tax=Parachaetomium inaequale TaxID=2588326 RepID=A0AAN6SQX1_9PEZI|nr:hypothetical protein C8A01DRAFT_37040 [Parachaetomium inaequale]